jgi:hypothetical protein
MAELILYNRDRDAGADGPAWNVSDVATALGVTSRSIEHLKKRFVEDGIEAALCRVFLWILALLKYSSSMYLEGRIR